MHELSIAINILEIAEQEARQRKVRVSSVHVRIGMLSGINSNALLSAFEIARCGTPLENSQLLIEEVPVLIECRSCGNREIHNIQHFKCPGCGAPGGNVVRGKEMEIVALEVD